jgi:hypothetical protein
LQTCRVSVNIALNISLGYITCSTFSGDWLESSWPTAVGGN